MKAITDLKLLFNDVQLSDVFTDSKTFCDCIPKQSLATIDALYEQQKNEEGFNIKKFIEANFTIPTPNDTFIEVNNSKPAEEHIQKLWKFLTRIPDEEYSSIIPLPHPYIVPGGRFREIYYWDSYFTMLGLQVSGEVEMIENMVDNFAHLISIIGYIPNGNRTYFLGRSQPPFFSLMVQMLADIKGEEIFLKYLSVLQKEYDFWMEGYNEIKHTSKAYKRIVNLNENVCLNRYWDEHDTPRPEAFKEDIELAQRSSTDGYKIYRHIRAAAESGWDFSSRWFKEPNQFETIHTTEIIPVDLNCLLYQFELLLVKAYSYDNNNQLANYYKQAALLRKEAILKYCFNEKLNMFSDYDWNEKQPKNVQSLAAAFPFYFGIANTHQAKVFAEIIEQKFLKDGGLVTTLNNSKQQWDSPNGWAPLHWITIIALENYGYTTLAKKIAQRWIALNANVFARTGKMMEKYNVIDTQIEAGGGEYPGQDGFGWTNGVFLAIKKRYSI